MKGIEILDYNIFCDNLNSIELGSDKIVINTINAYSYIVAKNDKDFKNALLESDILLPDGFPIVLGAKILKRKKIEKIAGEDIFKYLMVLANQKHYKVMFLGSSQKVLNKIVRKAANEYPNVTVNAFSPPYKDKFSQSENSEMLSAIEEFKPDILFVGMTAPKQEKWVAENVLKVSSNVICSIGAVFDFYAEEIKRPSSFWIKLRLEWFIRFINEPKRMWKRYFYYSPQFFVDLFKNRYNIKND